MSVLQIETVREHDSGSREHDHIAENDALGDHLTDAIYRSPSVFGRILLIAALLSQLADTSTGTALEKLHLDVFKTWQTYPVRQQAADIRVYLNQRSVKAELHQLVGLGERAVPGGISAMETQMFLKDLKLVKILLSYGQV